MNVSQVHAQIQTMTDPQAMRGLVLRAVAGLTEERLAHLDRLELPRPDRLAAIVAVLDEAAAYWALESRQSSTDPQLPPSLEEYREIAADTVRVTEEKLSGLLADVRDRTGVVVLASEPPPVYEWAVEWTEAETEAERWEAFPGELDGGERRARDVAKLYGGHGARLVRHEVRRGPWMPVEGRP